MGSRPRRTLKTIIRPYLPHNPDAPIQQSDSIKAFETPNTEIKLNSKEDDDFSEMSPIFLLALWPIVGFAWYIWHECIYTKIKLTSAAHDPKLIEGMLASELSGLKTDVPIKIHKEVTLLPKWDWVWFIRNLPYALLSLHPLDEVSRMNKVRLQQSRATITPIDFSPVIQKVLGTPSSQFIIVEGQKGIGKSTAMMLLCLHEIRHGRPALFLRLCRDSSEQEDTFTCERVIKESPSWIKFLAKECRELTIVIDDLHNYLKFPETHNNAEIIIGYLWRGTETYGLNVILPTDDNGLQDAIRELPMHHSCRFHEVRMYAPSEKELTKMIESGIKGKGDEQVEGNSAVDIARYCEVVGTPRELQLHYLKSNNCSSIKQVTQTIFNANVEALPSLLQRVLSAQEEKVRAGNSIYAVYRYTDNDLKSVLITLCNKRYVDPVGLHGVCEELVKANIIRHVHYCSGRFEFHSFQMEVAVRAILDIPATLKPSNIKPKRPESSGRGSSESLAALKSGMANFESVKTRINEILQ